jgi:hypothetical protein
MGRIPTALAMVCLGLAAACTTEVDATPPPPTTAITKDAFVQQGDAICVNADAESESLKAITPQSASHAAQVMRDVADLTDDMVKQLRALPQPPADTAELVSMYKDIDDIAAKTRHAAVATEQGDQATLERVIGQFETMSSALKVRLTAYGLTECGK